MLSVSNKKIPQFNNKSIPRGVNVQLPFPMTWRRQLVLSILFIVDPVLKISLAQNPLLAILTIKFIQKGNTFNVSLQFYCN